jgi:hypothetical protein
MRQFDFPNDSKILAFIAMEKMASAKMVLSFPIFWGLLATRYSDRQRPGAPRAFR